MKYMDNQESKSLINKVLDKVKTGQIKMRPDSYFVLKTVLTILGIFVIAIFILFLLSLISFNLRASGIWYLPKFGILGFGSYLRLLPWIIILVVVVLVILLEYLAKRFSLVYRRPIVYSLIFIVLLLAVGGLIIDRTPLHPNLFMDIKEREIQFMEPFYPNTENNGVYRGVISELLENGFILQTPNQSVLNVIYKNDTKFPTGSDFKEDEGVVVIGERKEDTITAEGILRIHDRLENFEPFKPRGPRVRIMQ